MLHKKALSTLVDDCIDKFRQHEVERKRLRLLNGQRGSTESAPVEFLIGGDPLSAALNECKEEDAGSPGAEETSGDGGKRAPRGAVSSASPSVCTVRIASTSCG